MKTKKTEKRSAGRPPNDPGINFLPRSLFARRVLSDMTQVELGEHVGVTDRTISRWENTKDSAVPNREQVRRLAQALRCTIGDFAKKVKP